MADQVTIATSQVIETESDLGPGVDATLRFWQGQLGLAERQERDWVERSRLIIRRYRDEREPPANVRTVRYNILWANTEVLRPVLYGRQPKPDVSRRHKNEFDEVAILSVDILQRSLEWEQDVEEIDAVLQAVVEDRLLCGRGVARVFYEPEYGPEEEAGATSEGAEEGGDVGGAGLGLSPAAGEGGRFRPVIDERAPVRYVFWEDYRESPARTEGEIWWKAYRSYLTRDELIDRFGEEIGKEVGLDYTPTGFNIDDSNGPLPDAFKKATVWEIWNSKKREVVWVAKSYPKGPLDTQDDPLELPGFFPSPPCLRATTTNEKRTPVPDFVEYQDQANELDDITGRIDRLVRSLKVAGVYAGSEKFVLQQLVDDNSENKLIPVEDWASFTGDKGGLPNLISWLPVQQIADVLMRLYDARDRILAVIYQTTGIADILRGETNPMETLGAQQLKTQFATRRTTKSQKDVARFARDLFRLRAHVVMRNFERDTLKRMTGLPVSLPPLPPAPPQMIPAPPQPQPMPAVPPPGAAAAAPGPAAGIPPGVGAPRPAVPVAPPPGPPAGAPQLLPPGARQAPDGRHYVPDPQRPGKYLMVA